MAKCRFFQIAYRQINPTTDCFALMLLLFVAGIMNLAWVAALTLAVAAEKILPKGERVAQLLGVALILAGVLKIAVN